MLCLHFSFKSKEASLRCGCGFNQVWQIGERVFNTECLLAVGQPWATLRRHYKCFIVSNKTALLIHQICGKWKSCHVFYPANDQFLSSITVRPSASADCSKCARLTERLLDLLKGATPMKFTSTTISWCNKDVTCLHFRFQLFGLISAFPKGGRSLQSLPTPQSHPHTVFITPYERGSREVADILIQLFTRENNDSSDLR